MVVELRRRIYNELNSAIRFSDCYNGTGPLKLSRFDFSTDKLLVYVDIKYL